MLGIFYGVKIPQRLELLVEVLVQLVFVAFPFVLGNRGLQRPL
jgi:hypothetical protein